jgi:hypothetical protein
MYISDGVGIPAWSNKRCIRPIFAEWRQAIFLIFLSVSSLVCSNGALAACTEDVYPLFPGEGSHFVHAGYCTTVQEAAQACQALASAHGYSANSCSGSAGSSPGVEGSVSGGWFWEQNGVQVMPFHHSRLDFGGAEPPQKRRSMGKPDCPDQCVGDPINAITGNKFETVEELHAAPSGFLREGLNKAV